MDNKAGPSNPTESAHGHQVWVDNVEAPPREKTLRGEDTLTLAQCIRLNQKQERAENCEQNKLIFELSRNKETTPAKLIPEMAMVYKRHQEKLAVKTSLQHSIATAIFATDPSNSWSWSVIFDSAVTKQIYKTRDATIAKDFKGVTYTYRLCAKVLLSSS